MMRPRLILVLIAVWLISVPAHASGMRNLTISAYDEILARVETQVRTDAATGSEDAPAALLPYLRCKVRFAEDRSMVFVDNDGLMSRLIFAERTAGGLRVVRLNNFAADIRVLRDDLSGGRSAPGQSARRAQAARAVISKAAYSSVPPEPPSDWDKILRKWQKKWNDFWAKHLSHKPSHSKPMGRRTAQVILIVIGILAGAVVIWFLAGIIQGLRYRVARSRPTLNIAITEEEASLVASRDFDQLLELARGHASKGDYRTAFRLVFVAILVALDADGIVQLDRSKTNWEYLAAVRDGSSAALYDLLLPVTQDFDRIWYGFHAASSADYARAVDRFHAIRAHHETPEREVAR